MKKKHSGKILRRIKIVRHQEIRMVKHRRKILGRIQQHCIHCLGPGLPVSCDTGGCNGDNVNDHDQNIDNYGLE